jgi:hypothetical protein
MNEKEKIRLTEAYKNLPDEEIIEMLSINRAEYEKGVYELIETEAKRRNLSNKSEEKEKKANIDAILCFNCAYPNPIGSSMCTNCNSYLDKSQADPLNIINIQGKFYRRLATTQEGNRPIIRIGKIIMASIFLIVGISSLLANVFGKFFPIHIVLLEIIYIILAVKIIKSLNR